MDYEYKLINPPVSMNFDKLDRNQARTYYAWYMTQIPERIMLLEEFVNSDTIYSHWKASFEFQTLEELGKWFVNQVSTRKRSQKEIEEIYTNLSDPFKFIEIPEDDLSYKTISLSCDIGMYFSQVLEKNNSGLRWVLVTKPKSNINYQQPVLMGNNKMECNPFDLVKVFSYGVIRGTKNSDGLIRLYETWSKYLFD